MGKWAEISSRIRNDTVDDYQSDGDARWWSFNGLVLYSCPCVGGLKCAVQEAVKRCGGLFWWSCSLPF
jgi:hypothetical protein